MELVLEILLELVWFIGSLFTGESRAERLDRLQKKRRRRVLNRWLKKGQRRGSVPDIGLTCLHCDYLLTGLTGDICPECGRQIDFETMAK